MSDDNTNVERDRQRILEAKKKGMVAKLFTYTRLSGPGWLQGAITLGGGSLAGSLYLGVIGGYQMLWLQPIMMILGIFMLSAIGYVALSTGERPFHMINRHVNPVLGWGWAIATLMANLVWAMPQFSLGTGALQQNLFPNWLNGPNGTYISVGILFGIAAVVIWFYDSGGWGIKLFEIILKVMVGIIVASFVGVVVAMTIKNGLEWDKIFAGFVPNLNLLFEPADQFKNFVAQAKYNEYWTTTILNSQRDVMVTAAATAVGINMTFLLPYSMLKRGWNRDFRGLASFDLSLGLFIPFFLATSCVVIASGSQFHGKYDEGLLDPASRTATTLKLEGAYQKNLESLLSNIAKEDADFDLDKLKEAQKEHDKKVADKKAELIASGTSPADLQKMQIEDPFLGQGEGELDIEKSKLPLADRRLAAMLVKRDANLLAQTLEELLGKQVAQYLFGIGVVGMAISTIIILMLINGFTLCEMVGAPSQGILHRFGSYLPGLTGGLGFLLLWGDGNARFWLAVPTSVFGMVLLPIAYLTFILMMNNRNLLGEYIPKGAKRLIVNLGLVLALTAATIGAGWSIWGRTMPIPGTDIKVRTVAIGIVVAFLGLALLVGLMRRKSSNTKES